MIAASLTGGPVALKRAMMGAAVALSSFIVLGTVAALWPNPFFIRMVPMQGYEIPLLTVQSALLGLFVAIRRPVCRGRTFGASSVLNFLGVACPICNKILLFAFGANALLTWFEPARLYVGLAGTGLALFAVAHEIRRQRAMVDQDTAPVSPPGTA
ncbi:MAG: hypothetical protein M0Z28_04180 [Rhodospirillales bacterium]|nr:hypothetical protein [Rhodospirillales bacterium]